MLRLSHPTLAAAVAGALAAPALLAPAARAADGEDTPLNLEPASGAAAETAASGGSGVLRTIVGLIVVIAVIYAITWVLKAVKKAREEQASGTALDSVATLPLGPNRSLHLVRAGTVVVLLGVSEGGVTPIRTYHEEEALALGLIPSEPVPGDSLDALLPSARAALTAGPPAAPATGNAGPVGRVLAELRRRTVI